MAEEGLLGDIFFDQELLNLIFIDNWQKLNWRFNVLLPKPQHDRCTPVVILHYTGSRHP